MENQDIEKLKKAAFELAEIAGSQITMASPLAHKAAELIKRIEAFKPKPEPLECWVNDHGRDDRVYYVSEKGARLNAKDDCKRIAVHLREVTPAPEWERWDVDKVTELHGQRHWREAFQVVADAHNAAMQRVTGKEGK